MDFERVEMILPLFYVQAQANNVRTVRNPPRFMCIVLHKFANLNDNHPFTQVQNCPKFDKNEMDVQRVEVILSPFLCVNTGTPCLDPSLFFV